MKKRITFTFTSVILVLSIALSLFSCGNTEIPSTSSSSSKNPNKQEKPISIETVNLMADLTAQNVSGKPTDVIFIKNQMSLSLKLFKESVKEKGDGGVLISPLSIQLALAMTANGADTQTKAEMENLLGGDIDLSTLNGYLNTYVESLPNEEKAKLQIANSIWLKNGGIVPNQDFLQTNKNYYDAEIYSSPFDSKTVEDINNWVNNNTDGMIDKIIDEIDPSAIMFLINAVMFDAEWARKYDVYSVREGEFTNLAGEKQTVDMMHSEEYIYIEMDNAVGFQKNYKGNKYAFVALLPDEGININDFVVGLSEEQLLSALNNKIHPGALYTSMPKFSFEFELEMNSALKTLGMPNAFDANEADFSKMGSADGNIYIDTVKHKTYISVDEAGTRAGAVTSAEMNAESAPSDIKVVNLDRPFLYMIIDTQTNLPIFIGTLTSVK